MYFLHGILYVAAVFGALAAVNTGDTQHVLAWSGYGITFALLAIALSVATKK
ncbi:MAG: hypothetical protein HYT94_04420 [Parcubacteria group bacterium]|nr:hypothetical protein [Parcubacteria group bacterium]